MNRLGRSTRCGVCRTDLYRAYGAARSDGERSRLIRQMDAGVCDGCQRTRHAAARYYIIAADHVRILTGMALALGETRNTLPEAYRDAVIDASLRCSDLRMWPIPRRATYNVPERFRENGDDQA